MNQALTTVGTTDLTPVTDGMLTDYLDILGLAKKMTPAETKQFLQIAQAYQLNPFKREIYATKYGEGQYAQFSIVVGYEVYLKRAERSGKLNGWKVDFTNYDDGDMSATITIWRKDWDRPFEWEVFYSEQVQKTKNGEVNKFWQKKRQQLRKVAISQGMRLAFPDENGGMPYTSEEMSVEVQDVDHEVVQSQRSPYTKAPVEQATAKVAEPVAQAKTVTQNKKQTADSMKEHQEMQKALENWHKALGAMLADPDRSNNPEAYQVAATSLKSIKGLGRDEVLKTFDGLKNIAYENGIDWDQDNKQFYINPDAVDAQVVEGEEVVNG